MDTLLQHKILDRDFYKRDTIEVAKSLLGKKLIRVIMGQQLIGIISQTEAYMANDPACHAYRGKTLRNQSLFGPVGHTYVYLSYGIHHCINIVSRDLQTVSGGVLIRELIPVYGQNLMLKNRPVNPSILTDGPGKLTQALAITKEHDSLDVTTDKSEIFVSEGIVVADKQIIASPRIGISVATDKLWCFTLSIE